MRSLVVGLLALALSACGKKPSGEACRARATELGTFLTSIDRDLSVVWVADAKLVVRDGLPNTRLHQMPVLHVKADGFILIDNSGDERPLHGPALGDQLTVTHERIVEDVAQGRVPRNTPEDMPTYLAIVVDDAVPWTHVVEATEAAAPGGFARPTFVFARTPKTQPPPRTAATAEIEKLLTTADAGNKATELANYASKVVAGCPALTRAFGAVASEESSDKAGVLAAAVGPALIECNCSVDLDKVRAVMWAIMGNEHPQSALQVTIDKQATPIELPAETPWREANKKLAPDANVWLAVKR